jgi:hypothetical protein
MSDALPISRAFWTLKVIDDLNQEALWIEVDISILLGKTRIKRARAFT